MTLCSLAMVPTGCGVLNTACACAPAPASSKTAIQHPIRLGAKPPAKAVLSVPQSPLPELIPAAPAKPAICAAKGNLLPQYCLSAIRTGIRLIWFSMRSSMLYIARQWLGGAIWLVVKNAGQGSQPVCGSSLRQAKV
jgi:hypothetical protein